MHTYVKPTGKDNACKGRRVVRLASKVTTGREQKEEKKNQSSITLNVRRKVSHHVGRKIEKNSRSRETKLETVDSRIIRRAWTIHFGRLFDTIGSRWDDSRGDIAGAKHAARSLATGGTMLSFPECEMHFFQLPFADNRRGNHGLGAGSREDIRALAIR